MSKFFTIFCLFFIFISNLYGQDSKNRVTVHVTKEGQIYWESHAVDDKEFSLRAKQLSLAVKNPTIDLKIDKNAVYDRVSFILYTINSIGGYKLNYVFEKPIIKKIEISLTIGEDGFVIDQQIVESNATSLENENALGFVRNIRFKPYKKDGQSIIIKTKYLLSYSGDLLENGLVLKGGEYHSFNPLEVVKRPESDPHYPSFSIRAGEEGVVTIEVKINKEGLVESAYIKKSSKFDRLDKSALHYVKQLIFKPTLVDNKPVEVFAPYTVTFTINSK